MTKFFFVLSVFVVIVSIAAPQFARQNGNNLYYGNTIRQRPGNIYHRQSRAESFPISICSDYWNELYNDANALQNSVQSNISNTISNVNTNPNVNVPNSNVNVPSGASVNQNGVSITKNAYVQNLQGRRGQQGRRGGRGRQGRRRGRQGNRQGSRQGNRRGNRRRRPFNRLDLESTVNPLTQAICNSVSQSSPCGNSAIISDIIFCAIGADNCGTDAPTNPLKNVIGKPITALINSIQNKKLREFFKGQYFCAAVEQSCCHSSGTDKLAAALASLIPQTGGPAPGTQPFGFPTSGFSFGRK